MCLLAYLYKGEIFIWVLIIFNWVVCLIVVNHIYSKGMFTSFQGVVSGACFVDCQALVSCRASLGPVLSEGPGHVCLPCGSTHAFLPQPL